MLASSEAVKFETQIVGKLCIYYFYYTILLEAIISSEKKHQEEIRNTIICNELGLVLEAI